MDKEHTEKWSDVVKQYYISNLSIWYHWVSICGSSNSTPFWVLRSDQYVKRPWHNSVKWISICG